MFCHNCGKEVNDNAVVCIHCGCSLNSKSVNAVGSHVAPKKQFCPHCGQEVNGDAVVCIHCGCSLNSPSLWNGQTNDNQAVISDGLKIALKIFMIIACVVGAFPFIIPLAWTIPLTVHVFNQLNSNQPIKTGVKVCVLIFCSLIAGILLLCATPKKSVPNQ